MASSVNVALSDNVPLSAETLEPLENTDEVATKHSQRKNKQVNNIIIDSDAKITEARNLENDESVSPKIMEQSSINGSQDDHVSNVVAIYIIRFDTKRGNIIEWQYPEDFDLKGVEFQALPSGLHTVSQDIIYFTKPPFVGLCAFRNEPTLDQSLDRGAHMAAVGVLVIPTSETGLCGRPWNHLMFLQSEILQHVNFSDDYSSLISYFEKRGIRINSVDNDLLTFESEGGPSTLRQRALSSGSNNKPQYLRNRCLSTSEMSTTSYQVPVTPMHPARHFPDFVRLCGPTIFLLWKAALLKKRILFYSQPPVGEACYSVYGTCLIANVPSSISRTLRNKVDKIRPLFNVGVSDIPMIEATEGGYVACTTDLIFQHKKNLYDLLVILPHKENQFQHPELITSPGSKLSTKINATDIRRYRVLLKLLASYGVNSYDGEEDGGDMTDTWIKMMFGGWFWWYGRDGYQRLNDDEYDEEDEEDGEDGEEITLNNQNESFSGNSLNVDTSEIEVEMIRFFQALTTNLFNTLRPMVSDSDDVEEDTTILYPDKLIQLGLDPHEDGAFVKELADIYFGKKVEVVGKGCNIIFQFCSNLFSSIEDGCCCFRI
ncbi:hypothetical protein C1645_759914 [Glomus cerebriforme]|uniref:UDENN domain-containing protein n=1 Tax=Glomus cerebriforme TaxID=658196 RepID=A0A397THR6_9GLOM|nr:hypothetical protein C1645_759914 [Glomus cerebriforme]